MYREFMIKDIAKMINGTTALDCRDLVRGISIDSRATTSADLFFALKGEHTDGHLYTKEALANGALAVVVEKSTGVKAEIRVSDTLFALGQLAERYRSMFGPKTIAITGTNGKTTVKNLIGAILNRRYNILVTKKNFNSLIGLPLTLFDMSGEEDFLVLEMGTSSPGEIRRLCEIAQPHFGLITNIGPGHLKGFGTIAGVRKEKLSLIDSIPRDHFAVVGEGAGDIQSRNVKRFSLDMLEDIQLSECGSRFTYMGTRFFTPLFGIGNVYNCLTALCFISNLGTVLGDDFFDDAHVALAEIKPEPGRMEPIQRNHLLIINDTYNANPVSMKTAIDFTTVLERKKVFVLGDMLELGKQSRRLHQEIGQYAKKCCDLLLTHGAEAKYYQGKHFEEKSDLVQFLIRNIDGDEVVLVKASRALNFEDIVEKLLRGL